jgi:hypothetical protein
MWHNASLPCNWPSFVNDEESQRFWYCMGDEVHYLVQDLTSDIEDDFDLKLTIYSWGRSGATIAPDGFSYHGNYGSFSNTLNTDKIVCPGDYEDLDDPSYTGGDSWVDALKIAQRHLGAFKYINTVVRRSAQGDLTHWWEELKAANDWTFGNEEEDEDLETKAA